MSSTDNPDDISDSQSRTRTTRNPFPGISIDPSRRREFSDASNLDSEESDTPSSSDSSSDSEDRNGSLSTNSDNGEDRGEWQGQSTTTRLKNPASSASSNTTSKRRRFTKKKQNPKRKRRSTSESRRRRIYLVEDDHFSDAALNKFHYRNYHTNYHRRAAYGKFSLIQVLRYWAVAMSQFTSKYHKEIFVVFFCIVSGLASLRTG